MISKLTWYLKLSIKHQILSVLILSFLLTIKSIYAFETIQILNFTKDLIHKQTSQECDKNDQSSYNLCYGRGMIFDVCTPPDVENWRQVTSSQIQAFQNKMNEAKIGSNFLLASLNFKFSGVQVRLTLPYLFFSGDKSKVASRIYLTQRGSKKCR